MRKSLDLVKGFEARLGAGWGWMVGVSGALLLLRMAYIVWFSPYGLAPDEAQYWHWLSHVDWGFATKPPLTTWLMGVSTWIFGTNMLGVKMFALLGQTAVPLLLVGMVRAMGGGQRAEMLAFFSGVTSPLVAGGGMLMAPDSLLLPLWLGAVWVFLGVVEGTFSWKKWISIGVLVGLGGLAKPTAGLFFPLVGLAALFFKRELFWNKGLWAAMGVALVMQAPVIYWNATHDWVTLAHMLWQVDGGGDVRHKGLKSFGEFMGSQLLVGVTAWPLILWAFFETFRCKCVAGALQAEGIVWPRMRWVVLLTLPILLMFGVQSLGAKVQANWPILGTIPALALMAVWAARRRWATGVLLVGCAVGAVADGLLMDTPLARAWGVPLRLKVDPTRTMLGNVEFGALTGALMDRLVAGSAILTTRYQTAAVLAFHTPGRPRVLYLNPGNRRENQYDLWDWPDLTGKLVLYVNEQATLPDAVRARFTQCQPWQRALVAAHGETYYTPSYWLCWGVL